jgi:hypothetical protein
MSLLQNLSAEERERRSSAQIEKNKQKFACQMKDTSLWLVRGDEAISARLNYELRASGVTLDGLIYVVPYQDERSGESAVLCLDRYEEFWTILINSSVTRVQVERGIHSPFERGQELLEASLIIAASLRSEGF